MEIMEFLCKSDTPLCSHHKTAIVFGGISSKIQNDLIKNVAEVMKKKQKNKWIVI